MLPKEKYPTDRALLIELWNNEIQKRGHRLFWVMQPSDQMNECTNSLWKSSPLYLTRHIKDITLFNDLKNIIMSALDKYSLAKTIIENNKIDIIQVRNGIIEGLIALHFKKKIGLKFSYHYSSMHGYWGWQFTSWRSKGDRCGRMLKDFLSQIIYRYILSQADFVQPINEWMQREINRMGIVKCRMLPTPLSASNEFLLYKGPPAKEIAPSEDYKKIIYCGSPGKSRELDFLIDAFALVKGKYDNVKLFFLGDVLGVKDQRFGHIEYLLAKADMYGIREDVVFLGQVPYEEVPGYLLGADIGVSPIPPKRFFRISSPSKCIEYLSLGLPVIANDEILDQYDVLEKSGGGFAVPYEPKEFAQALLFLLENEEIRKEMGARGKVWVEQNRTYRELAKKLEQEYLALLKEN